MQVVKVGKEAQEWVRNCVCGKCNSTLTVMESDLEKQFVYAKEYEQQEGILTFQCLVCKRWNKITKKNDAVSSIVWDRITPKNSRKPFMVERAVTCTVLGSPEKEEE